MQWKENKGTKGRWEKYIHIALYRSMALKIKIEIMRIYTSVSVDLASALSR